MNIAKATGFNIFNSNFALAKHTPPSEAEPMQPVYNTFSYLEGVIIQGHRNTSMYFYTCLVTSCNRARYLDLYILGSKLASLKQVDPKKNTKIQISCS